MFLKNRTQTRSFRALRHAGAAMLVCVVAASAHAQQPATPSGKWTKDIGVAVLANPEFQGSSSYNVFPIPYFDLRYFDDVGEKYFLNVPQGFGRHVYRDMNARGQGQRVSVAIAPGFANRDPDNIDGLETFGTGVEARVAWEYSTGPFAYGVTAAQALGTGHEGFYLDLQASLRGRIGQRGFYSVGPRIRLADGTYMNNLYGITAPESNATGLGAFTADAGLESAGLQGIVSVPAGRGWRLTGVLGVSRLFEDSEASPLTNEPTQLFFLTALTRSF